MNPRGVAVMAPRVPYEATASWVREVLHTGVASTLAGQLQLPMQPRAFAAVVPLLRHGVLDADGPPGLDPGTVPRLKAAFVGVCRERFVADARELSGDGSLCIRCGPVGLRTENPLTARFTPPVPVKVGAALDRALASIDAQLASHRGQPGRSTLCAVLGAQVLLTIHPFRDGNGRTARMFVAAKLLRHVGPAATALMGMLLMHRAGAHQYHQASWAFRAGDAEPMVALFVDSERLARERLFRGLPDQLSETAFLATCWRGLRALR